MPGLKTSEDFPGYHRYRARAYVYNRKSLQRSSDAPAGGGIGLRCCALATELPGHDWRSRSPLKRPQHRARVGAVPASAGLRC